MNAHLLEGTGLSRHYTVSRGLLRKGTLKALDGVSFTLAPGKTLAVVGESGCGKTTLARLVTLIEPPTAGSLSIAGMNAVAPPPDTLKALRRTVQMVFQDPYGSLNPRKKVGSLLEEPLRINTSLGASQRREAARAMMARVGLRQEHYGRYPHMFSGGQRQRIAIARALMLHPRVVVADEPVSALDVSIQAQIINLLQNLKKRFGLTMIFISHDLSVTRLVSDRIMVLYLGRVVELAEKRALFADPRHPYTQALLSAAPIPDPKAARARSRIVLEGDPPSPVNPPSGCAFRTRCPIARPRCTSEEPELRQITGQIAAACHFA